MSRGRPRRLMAPLRRLFVAASVPWLIVLGIVTTDYVRSFFRTASVLWHTRGGNRYTLVSSRGTLLVERYCNEASCAAPLPAPGIELECPRGKPEDLRLVTWPSATQWRVCGYGLVTRGGRVRPPARAARPGGWRRVTLLAPHWIILPFACIGPVLGLRRRRHDPGLCRRCGYDLMGNCSGRCPECGDRLSNS